MQRLKKSLKRVVGALDGVTEGGPIHSKRPVPISLRGLRKFVLRAACATASFVPDTYSFAVSEGSMKERSMCWNCSLPIEA
jgi:hypothetical protein